MTDRAPEDQAVHDRHPMIPQDTLDDAPGDHTCPNCGVNHLPDLEQHQPVCTGPTEKAGTGAAE